VGTKCAAARTRKAGARSWLRAAVVFFVVLLISVPLSMTACASSAGTTSSTAQPASSDAATTASSLASPGSSTDSSSTDTTGPLIPAKFYTNDQYKFGFDYPRTWEINADIAKQASAGSSAVFNVGAFDPNGTVINNTQVDGVVVSVYKLKATVDTTTMDELRAEIETGIDQLQQAQNAKTLEPLTSVTINGLQGFSVTYSFPFGDQQAISTLYLLFKGDVEYQVTLQAAEALWQQIQPQLRLVINSFTTAG
jgi:hypothetical protein